MNDTISLAEFYRRLERGDAILADTDSKGRAIVEDLTIPEKPRVYRLLPPPKRWEGEKTSEKA